MQYNSTYDKTPEGPPENRKPIDELFGLIGDQKKMKLEHHKENEFHRRELEDLKMNFEGYIQIINTKDLCYHSPM